MTAARWALATCGDLPGGDEDAAVLAAACARAGVEAAWRVWDDPDVDWDGFDAVLLRSTWDYTRHRDRFLAWCARVPRLVNPLPVVRWSSDKTYLADLAAAGVATVPTTVVPAPAAGAGPAALPPSALPAIGEVVVKPSVGAGSRGAGRFALPAARGQALAHGAQLLAAGRPVLVQPYVAGVDTRGETAVVCLGGVPVHAARKAPLLPPGTVHRLDGPVDGQAHALFVEEGVAPARPTEAELAVARSVLAVVAARFGTVPPYARVDLLPGADGPLVVELELVEPSLFLLHAPDPAAAADALVAAVRSVPPARQARA